MNIPFEGKVNPRLLKNCIKIKSFIALEKTILGNTYFHLVFYQDVNGVLFSVCKIHKKRNAI